MPKPLPDPVDPAQVKDLASRLVSEVKFPLLATVDATNHPRLRPVSPVLTEGFIVYVANLKRYSKTREIAQNPKVELCYTNPNHDQVRISGIATILDNQEKLQEIWDSNPLLRQFMRTMDNPELLIYVINPTQVKYMKEWALEYFDVDI